jgi:hypothetical protein
MVLTAAFLRYISFIAFNAAEIEVFVLEKFE